MERRARKRRTRSHDPVKFSEEGQESESETGTSSDRAFASGSPEFTRKGFFPSTLYGAPSVYDTKLMAVMGLLAYKDPANSPLGHLVSGLQNQAIADKVNDAVLGESVARSTGKPLRHATIGGRGHQLSSLTGTAHVAAPTSGLEFAVRHLLATRQASREATGSGGHAAIRPHLHF
ncbi:unnamed protein product [Laminaria digitata]